MTITYFPGAWHAVVVPGCIALLSADVPVTLVHRVWTALDAGRGFAAVLEELTSAYGTSLSAIPDFSVITLGNSDTSVVVRGAATVTVTTADEIVAVSGLGVTTWSERVLAGAASVVFAVDGTQPTEHPLPLVSGVVASGHLSIALTDAPPPAPVAEPVEAAPPPPPPPAAPVDAPLPEDTLFHATEFQATAIGVETELPPAPAPEPPAFDDYDDLWGETIVTAIEDAVVADPDETDAAATPGIISFVPSAAPRSAPMAPPVAPPPAAAPAPPARFADLGDHDGQTISQDQLLALQGRAPVARPAAQRASLGQLVLSTGARADLDRGAIIGRKPRVSRATGDNIPHLITVDSPSQDISRSHLEIQRHGGDIIAIDLNTTNGTRLIRGGKPPQPLHSGESTLLVDGDVLDIGEGVTITFEEAR